MPRNLKLFYAFVLGTALIFVFFCQYIINISFVHVGNDQNFRGFQLSVINNLEQRHMFPSLADAKNNMQKEQQQNTETPPETTEAAFSNEQFVHAGHLESEETVSNTPELQQVTEIGVVETSAAAAAEVTTLTSGNTTVVTVMEERKGRRVTKDNGLEMCPAVPRTLVGRMKLIQEPMSWQRIETIHSSTLPGGRYQPLQCRARHKVALILPYRNREDQLKIFTHHLHPLLKRQDLDYGIYVVNQADDNKFNRAMLFNVGYAEAKKEYDWDCYIFHDVDLLPEDDRNMYNCSETPRHMSVAVDTMNYTLMYKSLFGGAVSLSKDHFALLNGFSNQFWGWGGEDDDMWNRVVAKNLTVTRTSGDVARYTMIKHKKEPPSKERRRTLKQGKKYFKTDGLVNLSYKLLEKTHAKMYTNLTVELHDVWPTNQKHRRQRRIKL